MNRLDKGTKQRISLLSIIILAVFALSFTSTASDIYLDFSLYPDGNAVYQGMKSWQSSGTDKNPHYGNSLRLLYQGSSLRSEFYLEDSPASAKLFVTHLSSKATGCPGNGYSPVSIYINGNALVRNYDVAENHRGSHGYETDSWQVERYLRKGNNVVKWVAGDLCSHYWIKKFQLRVTSSLGPGNVFSGSWVNVNSDTDGITELKVTSTPGGNKISAYGQCHPTDCNWGRTDLHLLGEDVSDNSPTWAIARWGKGFAETTLVLRSRGERLQGTTYTVFKDDSGRSNYRASYQFREKRD